MPGQNKAYCQDESGNYGKTIWQYRWPILPTMEIVIEPYLGKKYSESETPHLMLAISVHRIKKFKRQSRATSSTVSYTHLTLPTTPYV